MAPGLPSSAGLCVSCWALPLLSPILQHQLQQRQWGEAGAVLAPCRAQGQGGRLGAEEAWLCPRVGGGHVPPKRPGTVLPHICVQRGGETGTLGAAATKPSRHNSAGGAITG